MSKKKAHSNEGKKENNERWLLTYSDMITLLLALFIILYAMSKADVAKFQEIAQQFSSAFHVANTDVGGVGAGSGTGFEELGSEIGYIESTPESSDASSGDTLNETSPLDEIYTVLTKYVNENNLEDQITLTNTSTFVQIRIKGVLMFYPDSPKMLDSSKPIMDKIADALKEVYDRVDSITISGNVADVGEHTEQTNSYAWYLSINRADTVRQSLVDDGLKEDKLSLQGFSYYNPIAPNDTESNRAQNRRAEITVYKQETTN